MPYEFTMSHRVEFAETDMAGIVHFANFFRFMEAAEVEFLRSLGLSVAMSWEGERIGFPRVSASCDFFRPARFQDVLDIAVRVLKIGGRMGVVSGGTGPASARAMSVLSARDFAILAPRHERARRCVL